MSRIYCEECGREFSHKQSLNRHRKLYCKTKKSEFESWKQLPKEELVKLKTKLAQVIDSNNLNITPDSTESEGSDTSEHNDVNRGSTEEFLPNKHHMKKSTKEINNHHSGLSLPALPSISENKELLSSLGAMDQAMIVLPQTPPTLEQKVEKLYSIINELQGMKNQTKEGKNEGGKEEENEEKEPKIDIVCLAKGDYIKKLIQLHDGDEEKAMNYIKNVGIATDFLEGDFRMIKKIYFDGKKKSQFPIRIKDFKRNKLEYLEENGEWILDIRGEIVGKRLCDNIVSTLLIANTQFNEVIIKEKDEDRKELLLDLFQINKTQAHIMKLLERKTQGKLSRRVAEFINYCTEVQAETGSLENVKKVYS